MNWNWKTDGKRVAGVLLAAALMALNMKTFVHAGDLYPGGVTGLTVLIQRLADKYWGVQLPYSPISLLLNAFPVYVGFRFVGKKFTLLSLLVIVVSSFLTDLIPAYVITYDPLLIAVFGGILSGAAVSLCLYFDATSGGTDFIAIYLSQKRGVETWNMVLGFNVIILSVAGFFFGWDKALYSIIFQYVSTQVLHTLFRRYQQRTLWIVTDHPDLIYAIIRDKTHHGATLFRGEGLYRNQPRSMIYTVVSADEVRSVVQETMKADPHAFINTQRTDSLVGRFYRKPQE
jgi:uncharacterized membrane-anchored protein YitT (DUF2179 family)